MAEGLPHHQHISGVSTQDHSQAFVGSARDVYFGGCTSSKEAPEEVARACRNALFLTDPHVDRESLISAKGTRVAGTCEWITHNESYRAWLIDGGDGSNNDGTRLLWISGGPGKGKTMMSVFLTEELERHKASKDDAELVFFFCSHQDKNRNSGVAMLRGLVHQIITKRPQLVKHALPYFETPERIQQTLSSPETLWIIFHKLVIDAELGTMFCVLDGLDECEDSTLRVLLPRIVSLLSGEAPSSTQGIFKLVIVSRDMSALQGCRRVRLDPDNDEKVVGDIGLFVSTRVHELSRIEGFDDEFRASVQSALLKRAAGTFLWVGFAMHELLQKQTRSEIWEILEDLPSGLPAIYSRMLLQIPAKQREMSRAILRWVTLAVRPLQLKELAAAASVRPSSSHVTIEQATHDAVTLCGPLLKIQEQEVILIHQSAQDYFLRKERDNDAVLEEFRLRVGLSHLELAQKCLDCIAQSDLQHRALDLKAELDSQESPLLRYAILYWPEHARSCSALAAELFSHPTPFLQKESPLRNYWWETYIRKLGGNFRGVAPPLLHMACTLDLVPWVEAVLAKKSWIPSYPKRVDRKDSYGETALFLAARGGYEVMVRLLVNGGADVKAKDNQGWTVLHEAARRGNLAVVRLLVDSGADVGAKNNNEWTVLHSAAQGGNEVVVRLLVDRGADVKAKNNQGWTVLHKAISPWLVGNEAVMQLLVDSGADVKAKDNDGETVLHSAALRGNVAVVRLLVDSGADVKAKNNNEWTVLHSAALGGNMAVVRLLVDSGADVRAKDYRGWTVLHSATGDGKEWWMMQYSKAKDRNEAVVQLLVDSGADFKAKDNQGWTVLHSAAKKGNEAVVRLLVDRGVDVKAKDNEGWTVLHSAAQNGNEAVVRLLVDKGADVKAKDKYRVTVLHSAAKSGNVVVVRLLVDRGVDVKAKDNNGWTVLHSAATRGNEAVVRLLVDSGVDVKAKDNQGCTVLHEAATSGNVAVVRLLVDSGADIKAKDNNGRTVFQMAVSFRAVNNKAVVQLLVDRGADVEAKDYNAWTVLQRQLSERMRRCEEQETQVTARIPA